LGLRSPPLFLKPCVRNPFLNSPFSPPLPHSRRYSLLCVRTFLNKKPRFLLLYRLSLIYALIILFSPIFARNQHVCLTPPSFLKQTNGLFSPIPQSLPSMIHGVRADLFFLPFFGDKIFLLLRRPSLSGDLYFSGRILPLAPGRGCGGSTFPPSLRKFFD